MSQCQDPVVKALLSICSGAWPAIPYEVLDDYAEDVRDNVVGSRQQASCGA